MIAACPKCATRYRIERDRLKPEGARLRCTRCETVFRVKPPAEAAEGAAAPAPPARRPAAPPAHSAAPAAEPVAASPRPVDRSRLVLVADPDEDAAKATASALETWGLNACVAHDGVEALLEIQRQLPRAVVLEATLPKMFGFQICELMKRNESLRAIRVILIGVIHARDRYRRPPGELYGADAYLEKPDLPDGLAPILRGFDLPLAGAAPAPREPAGGAEPPPAETAAAPSPAPPAAPAPSAAPAAADRAASARAAAERLARIIVSDVILYNEEKFAQAIARGDVGEAMEAELSEGRALFRQRVDPAVQAERDYLRHELMRVARSRGMKA